MNEIEDIEDHFSEKPSLFYGSFECPKCNTQWGCSQYSDPPSDIDTKVKCTCGAILDVFGAWVSTYYLEADLIDE